MAAAREISEISATVAAVLSEPDGIFTLEEEQK